MESIRIWNEEWSKRIKMDITLAKLVAYVAWLRGYDWCFNYSDTGIIVNTGDLREATIKTWEDAEFWFGSDIRKYKD